MSSRHLDRNSHELRPRVRRHLEAARAELEQLRSLQADYYSGIDSAVKAGKPVGQARMKTFALEKLDDAFGSLETSLLAHLKMEEALYPSLRTPSQVPDLVALVKQQQREHVALMKQAAALRREVLFVPPLKGVMSALSQHLQKQVQYEETRIFPALLGHEVTPETPMPQRYRTSDDVARSLRVARPEPEPEPEPEPGLITGFMRRWLKNR